MPEEMFAAAFAWEHYIEPGRPEGMVAGWFLDGSNRPVTYSR